MSFLFPFSFSDSGWQFWSFSRYEYPDTSRVCWLRSQTILCFHLEWILDHELGMKKNRSWSLAPLALYLLVKTSLHGFSARASWESSRVQELYWKDQWTKMPCKNQITLDLTDPVSQPSTKVVGCNIPSSLKRSAKWRWIGINLANASTQYSQFALIQSCWIITQIQHQEHGLTSTCPV